MWGSSDANAARAQKGRQAAVKRRRWWEIYAGVRERRRGHMDGSSGVGVNHSRLDYLNH
jgi:hypothetical protein